MDVDEIWAAKLSLGEDINGERLECSCVPSQYTDLLHPDVLVLQIAGGKDTVN